MRYYKKLKTKVLIRIHEKNIDTWNFKNKQGKQKKNILRK